MFCLTFPNRCCCRYRIPFFLMSSSISLGLVSDPAPRDCLIYCIILLLLNLLVTQTASPSSAISTSCIAQKFTLLCRAVQVPQCVSKATMITQDHQFPHVVPKWKETITYTIWKHFKSLLIFNVYGTFNHLRCLGWLHKAWGFQYYGLFFFRERELNQ